MTEAYSMTDKSPNLRQMVHTALKQERQQASGQSEAFKTRRFGSFIQASLGNLGISHEEMARRLALDPDLAKGLLDGMLPFNEIDDDLIRDIAKLLQYPVATLGLLLGRDIPEESETGQEARKKV
jgi:hypothetical protein